MTLTEAGDGPSRDLLVDIEVISRTKPCGAPERERKKAREIEIDR